MGIGEEKNKEKKLGISIYENNGSNRERNG